MALTAFVQTAGALLKSLAELALAALPVVLGSSPAWPAALPWRLPWAPRGTRLAVFPGYGGDWLALGVAALWRPPRS